MQSASEDCNHIEPEDLTGCPFECKTWLNNFPWDATNARFESTSFRDFLELIDNIPEVKRLFKSFELTFNKKLFEITNKAKDAKDPKWKVKLVKKLKNIKSLPDLNSNELLLFQRLMADKLLQHIGSTKHDIVPNVLLITSNDNDNTKNAKIIYNELSRKTQPFTFEDLGLIHKAMPLLESLSIDSLNIISAGDEKVVVDANELKSISVKCADKVESPVDLMIFLLQSYHWSVKSFKLEIEDGKIKQEEMCDDGERINNAFKEIAFQCDNLESLELNYFYKSINIAMLLNKLGSTKCGLKHLCLLGQPDSKNVFYYMVKDHAATLKSLTVSTYRYNAVNILSMMQVLEKFSYRWGSVDENVDVFKVLTVMPKLKYLELGHCRAQYEWVNNVPNKNVFGSLITLSLYNVQIKEHTFEKLNERLPNLKNVILTNCRIGVSVNSSESIIKFGNYVLDSLVLDSCKLFYSKQDVNPRGRSISRFKLSMSYHEPYATTIKYSTDETSESKLYIDNEYFVYDIPPVEPHCHNTNTLFIKANLIRSFSLSRDASEYVAFCPENEIEKKEDIDLIPERDIAVIDDSEDEMEAGQADKKETNETTITEETARTVTEVEVVEGKTNTVTEVEVVEGTTNTVTEVEVVEGTTNTVTEVEVIAEAEVGQKVELDNTIEEIDNIISLLDDDEDMLDYLNNEVETVQNAAIDDKKEEEVVQDIATDKEEETVQDIVIDDKEEETLQVIATDDKEQNSTEVDKKEEKAKQNTAISEKKAKIEEEEEEGVFVVSGSDDDEEIDDVPQEEQPDTSKLDEETDIFKKYRVPAALFTSDEDESLPNASLPGTLSNPIAQEDVDYEHASNHGKTLVHGSNDDSEYSEIIDIENCSSEKDINSTDEDYLSDDIETPVRKSLRKRPINTRTSKVSKKKMARIVSSSEETEEEDSSEEEEEYNSEEDVEDSDEEEVEDSDEEEVEDSGEEEAEDGDEEVMGDPDTKYSKLVSQFVVNCKKYNAVIRLPPRKKAKQTHASA